MSLKKMTRFMDVAAIVFCLASFIMSFVMNNPVACMGWFCAVLFAARCYSDRTLLDKSHELMTLQNEAIKEMGETKWTLLL